MILFRSYYFIPRTSFVEVCMPRRPVLLYAFLVSTLCGCRATSFKRLQRLRKQPVVTYALCRSVLVELPELVPYIEACLNAFQTVCWYSTYVPNSTWVLRTGI